MRHLTIFALILLLLAPGCALALIDLDYRYVLAGDRLTVELDRCRFHFELPRPAGQEKGRGRIRVFSREKTVERVIEVASGPLTLRSVGSDVELIFGDFRARFEERGEVLVLGHDQYDLTQSALQIEVRPDGSCSVHTP